MSLSVRHSVAFNAILSASVLQCQSQSVPVIKFPHHFHLSVNTNFSNGIIAVCESVRQMFDLVRSIFQDILERRKNLSSHLNQEVE